MRTLRSVAFLLVVSVVAATSMFAQQSGRQVQGVLNHDANGNYQFQVAPPAGARVFTIDVEKGTGRLTPETRDLLERENTCYFIRSYIMKREDDRGATHLDRVETCTPMSRIRTKRAVRIAPAVAP